MSLLAILDGESTTVLNPAQWALTGSWNADTLTATWPGSMATQDTGTLDRATVTAALTFGGATAGVVVRYLNAANYTLIEVDPASNLVRIIRVTSGIRAQLVEAPAGALPASATIRVDLDGPHLTIFNQAGDRLVSASVTAGETSGIVGMVQTGSGTTRLGAVTVAPLKGARVNWPVFSNRTVTADIPIVAGTWEDTDNNNPNVVWDPVGSRWVMYYTGYSSNKPTGDDGVQMAGIAYAATLDGPWIKEPANPVISELATGPWSQNGGMERLADGTWIIAANINTRGKWDAAMGTWFYTAPRPSGPWTRTSTVLTPYVGDPWLRINQTTGALEHWAWTLSGNRRIGTRWTSTDGGKTWSAPQQIIPNPPINGVNNGEQTVWVAPGREGIDMWVTTDFFPSTRLEDGRGMLMAYSPDYGVTWLWHVAQTAAGSRGWDARAAFDSAPVYDEARRRMYLFHAGSVKVDTGLLNFDIQIGHSWASWDHTTTPYVKGA